MGNNNMQLEHLLQIKITYLTFLFQAYYCCSYVGCVLCLAGFGLGQYLKLNALLSSIVFPKCPFVYIVAPCCLMSQWQCFDCSSGFPLALSCVTVLP